MKWMFDARITFGLNKFGTIGKATRVFTFLALAFYQDYYYSMFTILEGLLSWLGILHQPCKEDFREKYCLDSSQD